MCGLHGPDYGPGAAGKWTDAATGEHGDLLDLIAPQPQSARPWRGHGRSALLSRPAASADPIAAHPSHAPTSRERIARSRPPPVSCRPPVPGTPAEAYLRARGITARLDWPALRYHPSVYYRETERRSARNLAGAACRRHRSRRRHHRHPAHLARSAPAGEGAARRSAPRPRPSARQRRALRQAAADILAAGEGVETMLALKSVLPRLP